MISLEYLAGLVDGEGCIRLTQTNGGKQGGKLYYYPRLQVTNTFKPIIEELQKEFGGGVRHSSSKNHPNWKDKYDWVADGDTARTILKQIVPYLRIKKDRAIEVLSLDQKVRA